MCNSALLVLLKGSRTASERAFKVFDRYGRGTLRKADLLDALGDLVGVIHLHHKSLVFGLDIKFKQIFTCSVY